MSRHRDVRNMDYTEDYDGYDDVYGHSVDDDYYISPSNRQFLFNRENSREQPKIGEFIRTEQDIQEEDESDLASDISDLDRAKLESCMEQIKATITPLNVSKNELTNIIISHNYNIEKIIDAILSNSKNLQVERKEKGVTSNSSKFFVPKLNGLIGNTKSNAENRPLKSFNIPTFSKFSEINSSPKVFTVPKISSFLTKKNEPCNESKKFDNLSDLVSSHLSKSLKSKLSIDPVNKITQDVNNLKIVTSEPSEVKSSSSQYLIDLSVALKQTPSTQSLPSKSKHNLAEEKFEIPFVDCDTELETNIILKSSFDVKDILNTYLNNMKPVSNFGKILCRKYRRRQTKIKRNGLVIGSNIKIFDFATSSPDDSIAKHLKV